MKKKRKARVVWGVEDCRWGTIRGLFYTKRELLADKGCPNCKPVKFREVICTKK